MPANGASRLLEALDDGLAVAHEWDGAAITTRLAAVGLDAEDVRVALEARWEIYAESSESTLSENEMVAFVRGWTEGLLAGVKVVAA